MEISQVAHVDAMEHICAHPAAHLLKGMCFRWVSFCVSQRVTVRKHKALWLAIEVACHRGPWCPLVGHSDTPLCCTWLQQCFGVGDSMQVRIPRENSKYMIICVGAVNKAKAEVK